MSQGKNFRPVTFSSLVLRWGNFGPHDTFGCIFSCHSWAEDAFVMLWVEAKDTPRAGPIPIPTPKNYQNVYCAQAEKSCFNVFMEQLSFRESGN